MRSEEDDAKHLSLVLELADVFRHEGFLISGAEGIDGYTPPLDLHNDGYGDQEDKMPDISAYDEKENRHIIGLAKTGRGDFETDHALTQYNVFLDQRNPRTGQRARFYIIVPALRVAEFNTLITHYIHHDLWENLVIVQSKQWQE